MNYLKRPLLAVALSSLGACTTMPPDGGRAEVTAAVGERGFAPLLLAGDPDLLRPGQPLGADAAVARALMQSPQATAIYAGLGVDGAALFADASVRNPVLGAARLDSDEAGLLDATRWSVALSVADIVTLPSRRRIAASEFQQLKLEASAQLLELAASVRAAYFIASAEQARCDVALANANAATLAAALAQRFHAAGNIDARELAEARAHAAEAELAASRARVERGGALAEFRKHLGMTADAKQELLGLPLLPEHDPDAAVVAGIAFSQRLDLQAQREQLDALGARLKLSGWARWIEDFEAGFERERESDGERLSGLHLSVPLPLLNLHGNEKRRAEQELELAVANYAATRVLIENDVASAAEALAEARGRVVRIRGELLPQHRAIVERTQEQVNFMLSGVFDLIRTREQEFAAFGQYVDALADYWLAHTELERAAGQRLALANGTPDYLDTKTLLAAVRPATDSDSGRRDAAHEHHRHMQGEPQ